MNSTYDGFLSMVVAKKETIKKITIVSSGSSTICNSVFYIYPMRYLRLFEEFDPIVQIMVRICEDFDMEMVEAIKSTTMVVYRLQGDESSKSNLENVIDEYKYLAEDLGYDLTFTRTRKRLVGSKPLPTIFYVVFHKGSLEDAALAWLKEVYGRDMEQRTGVEPGTPWVRKSSFVEWMKDGKQILKAYDPQEAPQCADEAFINYHQTWAFLDEMFNRYGTLLSQRILCDWASYVTEREIKRVSIY